MFGLLNIYKPPRLSSYDVIRHVRRAMAERARLGELPAEEAQRTKRGAKRPDPDGSGRSRSTTSIGHAGTLDVLAEGVLVVCLGPAVRLMEVIQSYDKEYEVLAFLGAVTATDDAEGAVEPTPGAVAPSPAHVQEALRTFVGQIDQVPPAYSAVHVEGSRAYRLARRGRNVALAPRRVTVHSLEVIEYRYPLLRLRVCCSSGTYIRALVRDLGRQLGVGGYCRELVRTRVGPFARERSVPLANVTADALPGLLVPPVEAVPPAARVSVSDEQVGELRLGRPVPAKPPPGGQPVGGAFAAVDRHGRLVGLVSFDAQAGLLRPRKIFPAED